MSERNLNPHLSDSEKSTHQRVVVTGAGGFIGHHLSRYLRNQGYWVRGVDILRPEFSPMSDFDEFALLDLRNSKNADQAVEGMDRVFALAALNGSIEYTTNNRAEIMADNSLININTATASVRQGVDRLFYSSSACVYPIDLQGEDGKPLREGDAFLGAPDTHYGVEKLASEWMYKAHELDHGLQVRIARFFNIYGPECVIDTLRSKAPMALTRKVIAAEDGGEVKIWGDGGQVRSFCYVDDCVRAISMLMDSDIHEPVNIGTDNHLSINDLVDIIARIENKQIIKVHQSDKIEGVRNRLCDYTRASELLGWRPEVTPVQGMTVINRFVRQQLGLAS